MASGVQLPAACGGDLSPPWWRETIHHMGRRCNGWDYSSRCIYMVTITLADRSKPLLGRLVKRGTADWAVEAGEIGRIVEECWREIPLQWSDTETLACQVMPDHFHGILFVKQPLPKGKTLGNIVGSFKSKSASRTGFGVSPRAGSGASPRAAKSFWSSGYVDTILFRKGQLARMIRYIRDNPLRLGVKREHPDLFRVVRDLEVDLAARGESQNPRGESQDPRGESQDPCGVQRPAACGGGIAHFSAIGNHFLLQAPVKHQVQCSRSDFEYVRELLPAPPHAAGRETHVAGRGTWRIVRDAQGVPAVAKTTPAFEAKSEAALAAAAHGAVLVSPAISHGEKEIARRAHEAGFPVIVLQNKGFSPLQKPGGRYFEACANGKLLLLAPAGWPYVPGEKPPTRESSLVLNRIAQRIAGDDAAIIDYKGATIHDVDALVALALSRPTT